MKKRNTIRVFEAFSGYGGASFGLKKSGIKYKVIGFSERSFTSKDSGAVIDGMNIFVTFETNRTTGLACDRIFISRYRLDQCGYKPSVGDDIEIQYNRYGKISGNKG